MVNECVIDGRPTDSRLCGSCWSNLETGLRQVEWLVSELDTVLVRNTRYGTGQVGFVSRGSDERPLIFDMRASNAIQELRQVLGRWCWKLVEGHQIRLRYDAVELAKWLLQHPRPSWIRNHPDAQELAVQIIDAIRTCWRVVDVAPGRRYAGVCGHEGCQERLYGRESRALVTCQGCGAKHALGDRQTALLVQVEDELVELRELVGIIMNADGKNVSSSAIRNLKHRGRIVAKVNDNGTIRPRILDDEGPELFLVRDVIDAVLDRYKRRKPLAV